MSIHVNVYTKLASHQADAEKGKLNLFFYSICIINKINI